MSIWQPECESGHASDGVHLFKPHKQYVSGLEWSDGQVRLKLKKKGAIVYQLDHLTSTRLKEKGHNWYSTALFLYETATR